MLGTTRRAKWYRVNNIKIRMMNESSSVPVSAASVASAVSDVSAVSVVVDADVVADVAVAHAVGDVPDAEAAVAVDAAVAAAVLVEDQRSKRMNRKGTPPIVWMGFLLTLLPNRGCIEV